MSKPEFGRKIVCTACAVRFFDLSRSPAICPMCGVEQTRAKPRIAATALRSPTTHWPTRGTPTADIISDPAPIEPDPTDEVEEENEDDIEEIDVADDEDDALKMKHDD